MKKKLTLGLLMIGLMASLALNVRISYAAPLATTYEIGWWTVDGGGSQALSGGTYTLSGTVGQFDAGKQTGGPFTLQGGFWIVDAFGYRISLPVIRR